MQPPPHYGAPPARTLATFATTTTTGSPHTQHFITTSVPQSVVQGVSSQGPSTPTTFLLQPTSTGGGGNSASSHPLPPPSHEWICAVCGNINFAGRTRCNLMVCQAAFGFPGPYKNCRIGHAGSGMALDCSKEGWRPHGHPNDDRRLRDAAGAQLSSSSSTSDLNRSLVPVQVIPHHPSMVAAAQQHSPHQTAFVMPASGSHPGTPPGAHLAPVVLIMPDGSMMVPPELQPPQQQHFVMSLGHGGPAPNGAPQGVIPQYAQPPSPTAWH